MGISQVNVGLRPRQMYRSLFEFNRDLHPRVGDFIAEFAIQLYSRDIAKPDSLRSSIPDFPPEQFWPICTAPSSQQSFSAEAIFHLEFDLAQQIQLAEIDGPKSERESTDTLAHHQSLAEAAKAAGEACNLTDLFAVVAYYPYKPMGG